ncbi:MAG: hypothetical protein H7Z13_03980 [Ferruginibacter sp.]|nr:hypothetical protein [Ferruginibacter sp.]
MVIKISNILEADIIVFGGKPYNDSIVTECPFVMNIVSEVC